MIRFPIAAADALLFKTRTNAVMTSITNPLLMLLWCLFGWTLAKSALIQIRNRSGLAPVSDRVITLIDKISGTDLSLCH